MFFLRDFVKYLCFVLFFTPEYPNAWHSGNHNGIAQLWRGGGGWIRLWHEQPSCSTALLREGQDVRYQRRNALHTSSFLLVCVCSWDHDCLHSSSQWVQWPFSLQWYCYSSAPHLHTSIIEQCVVLKLSIMTVWKRRKDKWREREKAKTIAFDASLVKGLVRDQCRLIPMKFT